MKAADLFTYRRTCVLCLRSKPMQGAVTHPRFICAACREKREQRVGRQLAGHQKPEARST